MKNVLVLLFAFSICKAQMRDASASPGRGTSRWPYFGSSVPRYVALSGGYEGVKTNNFQVGLAFNLWHLVVDPPIGGMAGPQFIYKQSTTNSKIYSYEAEFGLYGGLVIGMNYNYNVTSSNKINGYKPFVGIAFYNFQMIYGYSFYKDSQDLNHDLRHNRITFRYIFPLAALSK